LIAAIPSSTGPGGAATSALNIFQSVLGQSYNDRAAAGYGSYNGTNLG
jgi:hypothetical protein